MGKQPFIMKILRCGGTAAGLLLAVATAAQQQSVPNAVALETEADEVRRYAVEMIIFEYAGAAAGTTEIFPPEKMVDPVYEEDFLIDLPDDITAERFTVVDPQDGTVSTRTGPPLADEPLEEIVTFEQSGLRILPPEDFQLTRAWERLVTLDAYRPLMHVAWEQPTLEQDETTPIRLRRLGDPPLRLDGTLSLYLSRFLHLVVDLQLEEQQPARLSATDERIRNYRDNDRFSSSTFGRPFEQPSVYYRIQEDRIVRNNEVRYYDHPKFGVIAKITRVEQADSEEMDTTEDLLPGPTN